MLRYDKVKAKDIIVAIGVLVVFAIALVAVLNIYASESERRSAVISDLGDKDPNHIEVDVKLVSIDPNKGDMTARLEFVPKGHFSKDGERTLERDLKLFVNSATGKQELDFQKGMRMNPMEVVINMYDGLVTDYPFDHHQAFLELYFLPAKREGGKDKQKPIEAGAAKPAEAAATPTPEVKPAEKKDEAEPKKTEAAAPAEDDVPIGVDFLGSIHGFRIDAAKSHESTEDYVGIDMTISRASTVKFFAIFIMLMMWGLTIAVIFLTLSVVTRGRKVEIGMFSFLAALLFAFAAVRNSQPGAPPIGTFSDFISFFWAEVIIALCLVAVVFTWLLRPTAR
jgi:hypothetical protein